MKKSYLMIALAAAFSFVLTGCGQMEDTMTVMEEAAPEEPMEEEVAEETVEVRVAVDDVHVVASGESLWKISGMASIYSDPFRWPLIYGRNDSIEDADLIYPDQELMIPRDLTRAKINAAIDHAKNRGAWTVGVVEESDTNYRASSM